LFGSLEVSLHAVPHCTWPNGHALITHVAFTHELPASHATLHWPQCCALTLREAHSPEQSVLPMGHTQRPWLQTLPLGQMTPTQACSTQLPPKQTESGSQSTPGQSLGRHVPAAHEVPPSHD
jgi:hypothetical protein